MTNVGGDDGGARLEVVEGEVLREACIKETTHERRDNGWGGRAREERNGPRLWDERLQRNLQRRRRTEYESTY